jgi:putative membrane protein
MKRFASEDAKRAFTDAIEAIEARSAAEVVIAVRHHSGSYLHADVITGGAVAIAALAFVLFAPFEFSLWSILIDPIVAGLAAGWLSTQLPWLRAALTPRARRDARVEHDAHAAFFAKGVRLTRDRTGVLGYVSLLERRVMIVPDVGVARVVPPRLWADAVGECERVLQAELDGVAVARALAALGDVCEPVLPRGDDDVNELADEVHIA